MIVLISENFASTISAKEEKNWRAALKCARIHAHLLTAVSLSVQSHRMNRHTLAFDRDFLIPEIAKSPQRCFTCIVDRAWPMSARTSHGNSVDDPQLSRPFRPEFQRLAAKASLEKRHRRFRPLLRWHLQKTPWRQRNKRSRQRKSRSPPPRKNNGRSARSRHEVDSFSEASTSSPEQEKNPASRITQKKIAARKQNSSQTSPTPTPMNTHCKIAANTVSAFQNSGEVGCGRRCCQGSADATPQPQTWGVSSAKPPFTLLPSPFLDRRYFASPSPSADTAAGSASLPAANILSFNSSTSLGFSLRYSRTFSRPWPSCTSP